MKRQVNDSMIEPLLLEMKNNIPEQEGVELWTPWSGHVIAQLPAAAHDDKTSWRQSRSWSSLLVTERQWYTANESEC